MHIYKEGEWVWSFTWLPTAWVILRRDRNPIFTDSSKVSFSWRRTICSPPQCHTFIYTHIYTRKSSPVPVEQETAFTSEAQSSLLISIGETI